MTKETSPLAKNSSATSPPSFALDGSPPNAQLQKLLALREKTETDLNTVLKSPEQPVKLYQQARNATISRLKANLRNIDEAIAYERQFTK